MHWTREIWREQNGDITNIGRRHINLRWFWPPDFHFDWFCYDGLPTRSIGFGLFAIGWGITHEWTNTD